MAKGKTARLGPKFNLGIPEVVTGHMLLVASSGGGKSWLIRLMLENSFGMLPHIVIDPEGELRTLREKYDYIIASADNEGDCYAHPSTAKVLARKLLELNASCIIDIYDLTREQQVMFVREFTKALVSAPKNLWGPRLVVIDEAHLFAPEKQDVGQASRTAINDLLSRGRKRGLGTVLATQRIAKLSKDSASECRNKLYGFCNLLADRKRCTDDLGFLSRDDVDKFRKLDTGEFYAVGPAVSREVALMRTSDKVKTTHPRPGENVFAHTPPPRAKVKKQLQALQDLPAQAKHEAATMAEAKAEIKELRRQLRAKPKAAPTDVEIEKARAEGKAEYYNLVRGQRKLVKEYEKKIELVEKAQDLLSAALKPPTMSLPEAPPSPPRDPSPQKPKRKAVAPPKRTPDLPPRPDLQVITPGDYSGIKGGARRMAEVLVSSYPAKVTKAQLATLASMKKTGGSFGTYLSRLRTAGLVEEVSKDVFQASDAARDWLGVAAPSPTTNVEVVEMWAKAIQPAKCGVIIRMVREAHPDGYTKEQLADALGMAVTGGSFGTYLSRVRANGLLIEEDGVIMASEELLRVP